MSFTGDLKHLPVVDIVQLLHSTRRSGTLCLHGPKGESQLGFSDGYIVSANHLNNSVRIGQVLVEMRAISQAELEQALLNQQVAGDARQPLIATLVESGKLTKELAHKGLETLIHMTIVEVLTWESGTFSLDVDQVTISDEYRYLPETLQQDFYLSTQNVLMDALRIFDERMRDGTLDGEVFADTPERTDVPPASAQEELTISADLLGLDELDKLEKKIPDVFKSLRQIDPAELHKKFVLPLVSDLPGADQERLISYLLQLTSSTEAHTAVDGETPRALIVFSSDELFKYVMTAVCKQQGYIAFTTDDEASLDLIISQSLTKQLPPLLIFDAPQDGAGKLSADKLSALRKLKLATYPTLSVLQLAAPQDAAFALAALSDGTRAVFPKPLRDGQPGFLDLFLGCINALRSYLEKSGTQQPAPTLTTELTTALTSLTAVREAPEVSAALLNIVTRYFVRALTLVVGKGELIAERHVGIHEDKQTGPTTPLKLRFSLQNPSLLRQTVESGQSYCGDDQEPLLSAHLYPEIGKPRQSRLLLLPLKANNRTMAVIYADFGSQSTGACPLALLEACARLAGIVLENILYRKTFEKSA